MEKAPLSGLSGGYAKIPQEGSNLEGGMHRKRA